MPVYNIFSLCSECYKTLNELKKYQQKIRNNPFYTQLEQAWVNKYLLPIIEMMGSITSTFPIFKDIIVHENKSVRKCNINKNYPTGKHAIFTGSHWIGVKNGIVFDPFDHCQIFGTNQFCQTYTLMWLTGNLPEYTDNNDEEGCEEQSLDKYYFYTRKALDFIKKEVLKKYKKHTNLKLYKKCIKVLKLNPAMCLNVVDLPKGI
jgi:hypothetical protein